MLQFSALRPRAVAAPSIRTRPATAAPATAERDVNEESQEFQEGWRQENRRWASVIYSTSFASNPVLAAHMLAKTSMSAGEITGFIRKASADFETGHLTSPAGIADRWAAAAQRAGIA